MTDSPTFVSTSPTFVSTGDLPNVSRVEAAVAAAYERFAPESSGTLASHYPALAAMDPTLFGICLVGADGRVAAAGDVAARFTIMSVAKPLVFALLVDALGAQALQDKVGVNATGLPYNSVMAVELDRDHRTNPMVNPGALATTSLVPGRSLLERWDWLRDGLSRFAGRALALDHDMLESARASNRRNRALAELMLGYDGLYADPIETTELYTRQSCLAVDCRDMAVMAATLADGGVNPMTGEQVISAEACARTLAVMTTAGLYESSGDWLYDVGLPAKSGVSGLIITVAPGKGGLATFAPPLDAAGNSVRGCLVAEHLSHELGLHLFRSAPVSTN